MLEQIQTHFKRLIKLLIYNWQTLLGFECIYKFVSVAAFVPLVYKSIGGVMKLTGYTYITGENVMQFFKHPISILYVIVVLFVASFYAMIDISAIIYILDQAEKGVKVGLWQPIRFAVSRAVHAFEPKNIMIAVVVLVMIPYLNFGVLSSLIGSFSLPGFIERYINTKWYLSFLAGAATVLVAFYLIRWLYAFHYYSLEYCDFNEARRKSLNLIDRLWYADALVLVIIQLFFFLLSKIISLVAFLALKILQNLMNEHNIPVTVLLTILLIAMVISVTIISTVEVPMSYATLSTLFYARKEAIGEEIVHANGHNIVVTEEKRKKVKRYAIVAFLISVVLCTIYIDGFARGAYAIHAENIGNVAVTAHRGASSMYPENTMSAFYGAKAQDATWIELDVEQSKDGVIFVCHDSNLKRTTGVNEDCWNMTYDEIKELNAAYYMDDYLVSEYMPTLEEVVKFAKLNNTRLNIEIKPTGHEKNIEQGVIDIIYDNNFAQNCVVSSGECEVLEKVKEIKPEIRTVYVTTVAYGHFEDLGAADGFSIEATTITRTLVKEIHNEGKEIYAWTVNTEDEIQDMIDFGVDNIVTDDVLLARKLIYRAESNNLIKRYLNIYTRDTLFAR